MRQPRNDDAGVGPGAVEETGKQASPQITGQESPAQALASALVDFCDDVDYVLPAVKAARDFLNEIDAGMSPVDPRALRLRVLLVDLDEALEVLQDPEERIRDLLDLEERE